MSINHFETIFSLYQQTRFKIGVLCEIEWHSGSVRASHQADLNSNLGDARQDNDKN